MRFNALRHALPLAVGAILIAAGTVAAQEPDQEPSQVRERENCICLDRGSGENWVGGRVLTSNRARLGILLGQSEDVGGRTGVRVQDVVEDGPAEAAGLQDGDIITAINGKELGAEPAEALVDAMDDIDPGDTVTVTYYRDGQRSTADVVTDRATGLSLLSGDEGFNVRVAPMLDRDRIRDRAGELRVITPGAFFRRMAPGGLELVEMNPGLGEYFGTDQGVLVADVGDDSDLGLQPGDVILAIDGRDVHDAAHVRAILDSYRPDETVTFRIVREQRTMEVTGTVGS